MALTVFCIPVIARALGYCEGSQAPNLWASRTALPRRIAIDGAGRGYLQKAAIRIVDREDIPSIVLVDPEVAACGYQFVPPDIPFASTTCTCK